MATFFVGMRVRLARPWDPRNIGAEGRLTHIEAYAVGDLMPHGLSAGAVMDCMVRWDRPVFVPPFMLDWCGSSLHRLEPILPSGHTASTESFQELMDRLNTQRVEKVEEVGA